MSEPLFLNREDGIGFVTPAPSPRDVRVLLSPLLQEEMEDFAMGITTVPPGVVGTLHAHPQTAEVWMFLSGHGRAVVGTEDRPTAPGDVVYTPPGVEHQFINDSDGPVTLFWLYSPAGDEKFVLNAELR